MTRDLRIACLTMAKDDVEFVDIWVRYYASIFGAEHCIVVDHGSEDQGALDRARAIGVQVLRLPFQYPSFAPEGRQPNGESVGFDRFRFDFMSKLRAALRVFYDVVIFHDVDEVLIPHPSRGETLVESIERRRVILAEHGILSGLGVEIFHDPSTEAPYDPGRPVLAQRRNACFRFVQCKPTIFLSDAAALPHSATIPFAICNDIWLLHLKFLDRDMMKARQASRYAAVERGEVADWTRWGWRPDEVDGKFAEFLTMPLDSDDNRLAEYLARHLRVIGHGCVLADRKTETPPQQYAATALLPKGAQREVQDHRFILSADFQSLPL